ncbi:DUF4344 domain-containing metallopeptidase [Nonomuraea sp. NPDC059023]|uniref:DUF4344 domain-containing metallopeptidase n=1 Tax=unclassified Nonomuraea TaxID=2593643 RepID=UPI0036801902
MSRSHLVAGVLVVALSACGTTKPQPSPSAEPPAAGGQANPSPSPSPSPSASASPSAGPGTPAFVPSYMAPEDKDLRPAEKLMRDHHLLQEWAESASDAFIPPRDIPVKAEQCDTVNAFYSPEDRTITMCYEMVAYLQSLFAAPESGQSATPDPQDVDESVVGAMSGIYYHELGHALIDLYDLPSTGKEEDAVDQLSALVLIGSAEDQRDYSEIISTIQAWGRMSQQEVSQPLDKTVFADEHSLSVQRYYNMMCYLYGSNHNAFLPLIADGALPVTRAVRCEEEYAKMAKAWATLLAPHMRTDLPDISPTPSPSPSPSPSGTPG